MCFSEQAAAGLPSTKRLRSSQTPVSPRAWASAEYHLGIRRCEEFQDGRASGGESRSPLSIKPWRPTGNAAGGAGTKADLRPQDGGRNPAETL